MGQGSLRRPEAGQEVLSGSPSSGGAAQPCAVPAQITEVVPHMQSLERPSKCSCRGLRALLGAPAWRPRAQGTLAGTGA